MTNHMLWIQGPKQLQKQSLRDKVCVACQYSDKAASCDLPARLLPAPCSSPGARLEQRLWPWLLQSLQGHGSGSQQPFGLQKWVMIAGHQSSDNFWFCGLLEWNVCMTSLPKHPLPSYFPVYSSYIRRVCKECLTNQYSFFSFFFFSFNFI